MAESAFYNALNIALEGDYRKLGKLREKYKSWKTAWENLPDGSAAVKNTAQAPQILDKINPEKEWARLLGTGIKLILESDPLYPPQLKEIAQPPFGIYSLGEPPKEGKSILAVVGTRKATREGKNIARRFAEVLSAKGVIIASGLAFGIDAAAHEGCLGANGKTIAVLGCGLDKFYPRTNERLAKKILSNGGMIISEYPLGSPPLPHRFLERNRIVSGISNGVLVIEAPERSGSLVTARFAIEQNRDVFVVPGPIEHPNYRGSNQLIRQGAELVAKPEEILESLGIEAEKAQAAGPLLETEEEKKVFEALRQSSSPLTVDKICELADFDTVAVNRALTMMILKDIAEESGEGYKLK